MKKTIADVIANFRAVASKPAYVDTVATLDAPGIYEWRPSVDEVYIGKSKNLRRRLRE